MSLYFTFIEPILISIVFCILFFGIGTLKPSKKDIIIFLGVMIILSILLKLFNINKSAIVFSSILITILEYNYSRHLSKSILKTLIIIALIALSDMVSGLIAMSIFKFTVAQVKESAFANITVYFTGILTIILMVKSIHSILNYKKLSLRSFQINKYFYMYIAISVLVVYLNVTILGTLIEYLSTQIVSLLIAIFTLYGVLGIVFLYMINENTKKSMKLELQAEENKRLTDYANLLEKQHDELRVFKHDYMNMLATLGGYIQLKDMEKLDRYFKEKILKGGEVFQADKNLELIKRVWSIPIRGMLYAKLVKIQDTKLDFGLDIPNHIPLFKMNELDVCKILGILIDNAIEAASLSEDKKLIINIVSESTLNKVIISNSFDGKIKDVNSLYHKGFSTKGEGRGLGLHTVKALLDTQYRNTKLSTTVRENIFIQEILFPVKPGQI